MKKEDLYNKIISNVAKEVKKALNEKYGIIEFDNITYKNKICDISKEIKASDTFDTAIDIDCFSGMLFAKYTYNFENVISWIKSLNVYYTKTNEYFDAGALTINDEKYFLKGTDSIEFASIYIIDNGQENIMHVLFHEMCHLYDSSKFKQIWMEDEKYFLSHYNNYNINDYTLNTDINKLTLEDIHNIFTEAMYYANFTESHAFMENINFQMFEFLNKFKKEFISYRRPLDFYLKSSTVLRDVYILEYLIGNLRHIEEEKKIRYFELFGNEIRKAYYSFNSFDNVANYVYKKLHKIVNHSMKLFNFYYNLDSEAKRVYKLDESVKNTIARSAHYICRKRI